MNDKRSQDSLERLVQAYDAMMEYVQELAARGERQAQPLREALRKAQEHLVGLGELSREEAEKIATYLERDMHDIAEFIHETGQDFREWFRFDVELIERRLLDMFIGVADQTSIELRQFADRAREASRYRTGEVTGPGTLVCAGCGKELHFRKTGHIPPCAACKGTRFQRRDTGG